MFSEVLNKVLFHQYEGLLTLFLSFSIGGNDVGNDVVMLVAKGIFGNTVLLLYTLPLLVIPNGW